MAEVGFSISQLRGSFGRRKHLPLQELGRRKGWYRLKSLSSQEIQGRH
jgi:hypothetical protein